MESSLSIALVQIETTPDPAANLANARIWARRAAGQGADLVVFPEMFMGLPKADCPPAQIAAADQGKFVRGLEALAAETGVFVVSGSWEPGPEPRRAYNTAHIFSPEGRIVASYRKLHLFDALNVRESDIMTPGDDPPPVVDIAGVRVGLAICYDLRFPEIFRYLAVQGAQLVLVPSAWYQGPMKAVHWLTLLRARAIENTFYVAGCNLVGSAFCGSSAVFDPFGVIQAGAGEVPTLVSASVDIQRLEAVRHKLPSLRHRRLDLFAG
ncbi:MAG: carbon-nitrogen hydrolase family protein [Deltaproteobacteria bacterium]|nr:carbon-nitrogen hydrolase family protein [Deltaproteobacteria bacterium]